MGRIAEALKRAEQERRLSVDRGQGAAADGAASPPSTIMNALERASAPGLDPTSFDPVPVVEGLSESLVPFFDRSSLVTEQYRSLRTRILSQNLDYEHRVIAVTSAVPKEGKSVTSLNLGCILAEIRHLKVLVVDGDFRRSSLAQMLNQPPGPGLADVLAGKAKYDDVLRSTPIPNLSFLPAGSTQGRSAAELLATAGASPTFRRIQNDFHYAIVDTPPATTVTDVGIIGQLCSAVIMLVRLHRTHEADARRAVRLLQVNNIPIMGCLLVGRDGAGSRYGDGDGSRYNYYRYYRHYGSGES